MGGHDATNKFFHVPAVFDKLRRKPVQQFRVTRQIPLGSKVLTCFDKSVSKKLLPESETELQRRKRLNSPITAIPNSIDVASYQAVPDEIITSDLVFSGKIAEVSIR